MPELKDLTLRHVDPSRLLFARVESKDPNDIPSWFEEASSGGVHLEGWAQGSIMVTLETKVQRPAYVAAVSVAGLFATDEQAAAGAGEPDDALLGASTRAELDVFVQGAVKDLYPFLRAELYSLTSRYSASRGVMLQPNPVLGGPAQEI